MSERM